MSSKFKKKDLSRIKQQEEAILDRDLEEFQGSAVELFFIKLGRRIQRNRLQVFSGVLVFFILIASVIGYFEYITYKETKATEKLEVILESWDLNPTISVDTKLETMNAFAENDASGNVKIRVAKVLSDLYVGKEDYKKAAELLEKAGREISELREAKAYFFYLAGNYRELADDKDLALKNYQTASGLLENLREITSFRAWSLYHTGRLLAENGDKTGAGAALRKVLLIEASEQSGAADLEEIKKLSSYLLLKISQSS
ncbi:tetratricopeptide repeat protein [Leptospira sp. GIMC2001]|uniref:tetratricopeptide repeat protein n=1 Tax=Leptospira sp. GIMC2001 TaxID=1513297 RepID=UPI002349627D|nr:hypothetical protein [Leptospira sp. GIMC2001]WCL48717.1 hypothetical protein O4O04_15605 [Leptospira sp. GIMC2001]